MRRVLAVLALVLVLPMLLLSACGAGGDGTSPEAPPTAGSSTSAEEEGASTADPSPDAAPTASAEPTPAPEPSTSAAPVTTIEEVWLPDTGWDIESLGEDLCAMGGPSPSVYSHQDDMFTCGPIAAGADACVIDHGATVLCITDHLEQQAITFVSPIASEEGIDRSHDSGERMPLYVTLPDGATCATISHDHDQHWDGMASWYRCDDGSELLTEGYATDTFTVDGELWTAQRSVDQQEPETVEVVTAAFAGD